MAYGFGNYNMGLGMGYPQTYGIGFNTNPIQQTESKSEVNPTAYTSTAKSDDSGAKVGALIVASAALAGLMIHGANVEKSAKTIAEAIEKNAPETEKVEQKVEKAAEEVAENPKQVQQTPKEN